MNDLRILEPVIRKGGDPARNAQVKLRIQEIRSYNRAIVAGQGLISKMSAGSFYSPWDFLQTVKSDGKVTTYYASLALNALTEANQMVNVHNKGLRAV